MRFAGIPARLAPLVMCTIDHQLLQGGRRCSLSDSTDLFGSPRPLRLALQARWLALSAQELDKRRQEFQDLFAEAKLALEDAEESMDTTYFDDDLEEAKRAVAECLDAYKSLLKEAEEKVANSLRRENGLKVEQMTAQLDQILEKVTNE